MGNSVKGSQEIANTEEGANSYDNKETGKQEINGGKNKKVTVTESDNKSNIRSRESALKERESDPIANVNKADEYEMLPEDTGNVTRISTEIPKSSTETEIERHGVFVRQTEHGNNLRNQNKHVSKKKDSFQKTIAVKSNTLMNETKMFRPPTKPKPVSTSVSASPNKFDKFKQKHLNENEVESRMQKNETEVDEITTENELCKKEQSNNPDRVEKGEENRNSNIKTSAERPNFNKSGNTKLSSNPLSNVKLVVNLRKKVKNEIAIKTRAQSEPVRNKNANITRKSTLGIARDEKPGEIDKLIETELGTIDDEESEYETNSSLRSTTLDSRLFDSQSSIVTHTSVDQQTSENSYSENKQKLKQALLEIYKPYCFTKPESPLLPFTDEPSAGRCYWQPWMTITRKIESEADLELDDGDELNETVDMNNYEMEQNINQFRQLFHHEGQKIKNVYIVGESGTGKTAFCRHLLSEWCLRHQQQAVIVDSKETMFSGLGTTPGSCKNDMSTDRMIYSESQESIKSEPTYTDSTPTSESKTQAPTNLECTSSNVFSDSDELLQYEFLFYIPLFFKTNHNHIHDLIKTQFKGILNEMAITESAKQTNNCSVKGAAFLDELLNKESEKCFIILDGLDVWKPKTKRYKSHVPLPNIPEKDPSKSYTVLVTSTHERLSKMRIEAKASDLEVTLNGIEESTSRDVIRNLLDRLNKFYGTTKKPDDMISEINHWKTTRYQRLPLVLQSLVCLWYYSGEIGNTVCDVFSRILEIQFKRFNDSITGATATIQTTKVSNPSMHLNAADKGVHLPRYYIDLRNCQKNKVLISVLGNIAWNTRIQSIKSFDSSSLEVHGFSQDDVSNLIKAGVLSRSKVPGFSEVLHGKTVFFPDKSMQEFLAITYLAILCRDTAYNNIGKIELHTHKIRSVVETHLNCFSSLENIFEFSNLIILLCGLYPPTVELITQKIHDVVSADTRVLEFRTNLEAESEDTVCEDVQELIRTSADESLSVYKEDILLHIGDISYRYLGFNYLKYVEPSEVRSLLIDADDSSDDAPNVSEFIHQARIFQRLQKLLVKDESSKLTLQDIESIYIVSECCASTLNAVSYIFNNTNRIIYLRVTQNLDRLLPQMSNLLELELKRIKLSHVKFGSVAWCLSQLTYLKRLQLSDITCEMQRCDSEEHVIDFSDLENLEYIDVDGREIPVVALNKRNLNTCILGNLPQGPEIRTFSSLRNSDCLKHFKQKVRQRPPFISQTLIKTLNTWHKLETLKLSGVNFGENKLIFNKEMENLTHIRLVEIRMSRLAWCNFVNCLPDMVQEVTVVTRDIQITPIEVDVTRDPLRRPIDAETRALMLARETGRQDAFDYVRGKSSVFCVLFDLKNMFDFKSKQK